LGISKLFPGDKLPWLLRHPTSQMRAGGMPTVTLNDAQLKQLVAYLDTLGATPSAPAGAVPAAAPPTQPGAAKAAGTQAAPRPPLSPLALRGQKIFQQMRCETCHGVGGLTGTVAAPPLAGTASLLPAATLEQLLRHHSVRMQQGGMPLTNLNPPDMKALIAFIRSMPAEAH